jgi:transcriptional regulator with XRE-family HTH domain
MSGIPAIGDVVREWRRYRQISLTEFSKRTKRSKGYISELEHNKIDNPKLDKLKRIAAALGISVRDIVSRRMPDEVNEGNVASEEDMQGLTLVKVEDDETEEEEQFSIVHSAIAIPWKAIPDAPCGTTEEEMDEIVSLIASAGLSDEEEERINATLFEIAKQLLSFIATQRKTQKQG